MNPTIALAVFLRVVRQLQRDPRTVALLLGVPIVLLALVRFIVNAADPTFDRFGLPLLGIFPLTSMFLVTSIAMLRERTSGTLERQLTLPMAKADLLAGYGLAFGAVAVVQAAIAVAVGVALLGLETAGPIWAVVLLAVGNAVLGMAMGLFVSAFAATEFQAVQFMPAFLLPQLLLCGLVVTRDQMATPLHWLSSVLPMTFAFEGLDELRASSSFTAEAATDLVVVALMAVAALGLGAATLRRRTE
jgi:ABC-2 type transport system permease protein